MVLGLLLAIIAIQACLLYLERTANRASATQSAKLLTTFLQGDTSHVANGVGVSIRLQNVRFKWSDKIYVDTDNMAVRAVPIQGSSVDFDDLNSFVLSLQQSEVLIHADVLEGMLNESVFNFPESKVRDLKARLTKENGRQSVQLNGRVNVGVWIPFMMLAHLDVDTATNTLVMNVDQLKALGFIPAIKFVRWTPFHLDRLIAVPPNKTVMIDGNRIMIKPLGLFPPPRINGTMSSVVVDSSGIRLNFAGKPIDAPKSSAKNYVYLRGGTSQFGHFCMKDTDVLILDKNPADPFVFSLQHYAEMIPKSNVEVHDTQSVRVTMPDHP